MDPIFWQSCTVPQTTVQSQVEIAFGRFRHISSASLTTNFRTTIHSRKLITKTSNIAVNLVVDSNTSCCRRRYIQSSCTCFWTVQSSLPCCSHHHVHYSSLIVQIWQLADTLFLSDQSRLKYPFMTSFSLFQRLRQPIWYLLVPVVTFMSLSIASRTLSFLKSMSIGGCNVIFSMSLSYRSGVESQSEKLFITASCIQEERS